jgi:hypothetical protein
VQQAFLATYPSGRGAAVCITGVSFRGEKDVVQMVAGMFQSVFNANQFVDILFPGAPQLEQLCKVGRPFFARCQV